MAKGLKDHNYYGIDSTIVADSINEFGDRIVTFVVTHPRHILAEVNTHRMFSRNSASSRAIPAKEMIRRVREQPFIPIAWQREHSGMQGNEYLEAPIDLAFANDLWLEARDRALKSALALSKEGTDNKGFVTKQISNRLLEPFLHHTAIITATEYENFFKLRCPQYQFQQEPKATLRSRKDYRAYFLEQFNIPLIEDENSLLEFMKINKGMGEIHIMALAESMWDNYNESKPKLLKAGQWHIPFGDQFDLKKLENAANYEMKGTSVTEEGFIDIIQSMKRKIATARCARISYGTFEGKEDYEADIKLYGRLLSSMHLSPFEHVAKTMSFQEYHTYFNGQATSGKMEVDQTSITIKDKDSKGFGWCRNFKGFIQERALIDK